MQPPGILDHHHAPVVLDHVAILLFPDHVIIAELSSTYARLPLPQEQRLFARLLVSHLNHRLYAACMVSVSGGSNMVWLSKVWLLAWAFPKALSTSSFQGTASA